MNDAVLKKKKTKALRRWCCHVGVVNLLAHCWVNPLPQKQAFNVVFDDDEEEGLSEIAQRVSMMLRRCLSVRCLHVVVAIAVTR